MTDQTFGRLPEKRIARMMIDYNVRDDWPESEPHWLKSLVSSLSRKPRSSLALPLTATTQEIRDWVQLASGEEAWARKDNQRSLRGDLGQSIAALGPSLQTAVTPELATLQTAFGALLSSGRTVLSHGPGLRTDQRWADVEAAADALLAALGTDDAVGAGWDDLVAIAKDRTLETRNHQLVADLLFDMLNRRGQSAERLFRQAVDMLAYGREPGDLPFEQRDVAVATRVSNARELVLAAATIEPIAVWLGFKGGGYVPAISAGKVQFFNAPWHIPNSAPGRPDFPHKAELAKIVQYGGIFKWQERIGEDYDVDFLIRVDLGETTAANAFERAIETVDTILAVAVHDSNGIRPHLAQYVVVQSGEPTLSSFMVSRADPGFPDDHHGARLTVEGLEHHAAKIADALATADLPRFLSVALEAQTAADLPFSRAFALRRPSEADRRAVVPLADRVVQQVAAYAAMKPSELFDLLMPKWAHARWVTELQNAVLRCLLGGGPNSARANELLGQFYSSTSDQPWMLFATDDEQELLDLCRVEHERGWIAKMLRSLRDLPTYQALIAEFQAECDVLGLRRTRVRNAVVHGNPAQFAVVESVREFAEFLSNSALGAALEAFTSHGDLRTVLSEVSDLQQALSSGQTAADYWRYRVATARASEDR
jgi:hypothetical protein